MLKKATLACAVAALAISGPVLAQDYSIKFRLAGLSAAPAAEPVVSWDQFVEDRGLAYGSGWNSLPWTGENLSELPGEAFPNPTPSGDIKLSFNKLTNLGGMSNLISVGGNIDLSSNQLTNLNDLKSLTHAGGLRVSFNQLTDIDGLEKLESVGLLYLINLPITNVDGLSSLKRAGSIHLFGSPNLVDLRGLAGVEDAGFRVAIDKGIQDRLGFVPIPYDAPLCQPGAAAWFNSSSYATQADVCDDTPAETWAAFASERGLAYDSGWNSINWSSWSGTTLTELPNKPYPNSNPSGEITLSYNPLGNVDVLSSIHAVGNALVLNGASLTNINGLKNLARVGSSISLHSNKLTTTTPLENLRHVGGNLTLYSNPNLADFSGLAGITSMTGKISVEGAAATRSGFKPIPSSAWLCQPAQSGKFSDGTSMWATQAQLCAR